jgi:hypothetical protein
MLDATGIQTPNLCDSAQYDGISGKQFSFFQARFLCFVLFLVTKRKKKRDNYLNPIHVVASCNRESEQLLVLHELPPTRRRRKGERKKRRNDSNRKKRNVAR